VPVFCAAKEVSGLDVGCAAEPADTAATIRGGPVGPGLSAIDLNLGEVKLVNAASPAYASAFGGT
jgi:hypothetical protein